MSWEGPWWGSTAFVLESSQNRAEAPTPRPRTVYLQNGQQPPLAAAFVAAAAVGPKSARSAAMVPRNFVFIVCPLGSAVRGSPRQDHRTASGALESQPR